MGHGTSGLTFNTLRGGNIARLPEFKDKHGRLAHSKPDGSDWSPAQWLQAVVGELGEYANIRKKVERGDLTVEEAKPLLADELADVVTYLDILAFQLDIDLGLAVMEKFNRVSERVASTVRIDAEDWHRHPNGPYIGDTRVANIVNPLPDVEPAPPAVTLSAKGVEQMNALMDNPPAPTEFMRKAMRAAREEHAKQNDSLACERWRGFGRDQRAAVLDGLDLESDSEDMTDAYQTARRVLMAVAQPEPPVADVVADRGPATEGCTMCHALGHQCTECHITAAPNV